MRVDLHIHSTASDGRWTPGQIVQEVRQAGIDLFAVADHDSVASVRAVESAAKGSGLSFLRAVEVSCTLDGDLLHILGYGIAPEDPRLERVLAENRVKMESVDRQSIQRLIDAGYPITHHEYEAYENDPTRGGWKALNLFIDRGFCRDVRDFFGRLFTGDMALTMPPFAPPEEVVGSIRAAGGSAICAHPGNNDGGDTALLDQLVACGVEGLECYSPYHDQQTTAALIGYCLQRRLLITAGSDCHGGFVGRALGQPEAHLRDLDLGLLRDLIVR